MAFRVFPSVVLKAEALRFAIQTAIEDTDQKQLMTLKPLADDATANNHERSLSRQSST